MFSNVEQNLSFGASKVNFLSLRVSSLFDLLVSYWCYYYSGTGSNSSSDSSIYSSYFSFLPHSSYSFGSNSASSLCISPSSISLGSIALSNLYSRVYGFCPFYNPFCLFLSFTLFQKFGFQKFGFKLLLFLFLQIFGVLFPPLLSH